MKILYLLRGLPGSGKSTLAETINIAHGGVRFAADDFFTDENGNYNFELERVSESHAWCNNQCRKAMEDNIETIVIHNTFLKREYLQPYLDLANQFDYKVVEIFVSSEFKSVHGVPDEVITSMKESYIMDFYEQHKGEIDDITKR